ncbi:MAG TPA: DUF1097 domain-containing protein [Gemmatimonadales bacterium]|nr:DUF1097 domain-containing protein [Gemmatimonadales bacterium]
MDRQAALALSTGVLVALWTFVSLQYIPDLSPWVGIAALGCFFAAGGKTQGFQKTVFATISGMLYVWVMMQLLPRFGGSTLLYALLMGVIAVVIMIMSKVPALSFIPGALVGAAVTVGNGAGADLGHMLYTGVSLVIGAALGFAAETTAASLATKR